MAHHVARPPPVGLAINKQTWSTKQSRSWGMDVRLGIMCVWGGKGKGRWGWTSQQMIKGCEGSSFCLVWIYRCCLS